MNRKMLLGGFVAAATIAVASVSAPTGAQERTPLTPPPAAAGFGPRFLTGPNAGEPVAIALAYLRAHAGESGATAADVADLVVTDAYRDADTGVTHVYVRQRVGEIEITEANASVNIAADGSVINAHSAFVPGAASIINTDNPGRGPEEGVDDAARAVGLTRTKPLKVRKPSQGRARKTEFEGDDLSTDPIPAELVYVRQGKALRLAWTVRIHQKDGKHWWQSDVDAVTGESLGNVDYVDEETSTHTVFAQPLANPSQGPRVAVVDPADPVASPFGWNDTNGVAGAEGTLTRGNNVLAATDIDANNAPDAGSSPDGGVALVFNFPLDLTLQPSTYRPASVSNLYYWNNVIHDITYGYGFTEAAGNFQFNNYGRGGLGADAVNADAQDGSGTNNANFGTPPDGQPPRMQMFRTTFSSPQRDTSLDAEIIVHEYAHGISNRLTGGPANVSCLNNTEQMGEGWSDYISLALTTGPEPTSELRAVGSYSFNRPNGIRPTPYTRDMTINPSTYDTIKTAAVPHGVGYVWATMLWDLSWNLVGAHGYNPDIRGAWNTGGNNLALQLVMDGLKLQPCSPGFVDGRDAILLADQVRTGGANACTIWTTFARRGLGANALQGSNLSVTDNIQGFIVPSGVCGGPLPDLAITGSIAALTKVGETTPTAFVVSNIGGGLAQGTIVSVSAAPGVSVLSATSTAGNCVLVSGEARCTITSLAPVATATITATLMPAAPGVTQVIGTVSQYGGETDATNNTATVSLDPFGSSRPTSYTSNVLCAIPDPGTVNCPLTLPADTALLNVEVRIRINHPWDGDLVVSAVAPDGTVVPLVARVGFNRANFGTGSNPCDASTQYATFADTAARPPVTSDVPFVGRWKPSGSLSSFIGRPQAGIWHLRVSDVEAPDRGTVLCWGLDVINAIPATPSGITYTGATAVQYSDPANVSAVLAATGGAGIAAQPVALTFGSQSTSATTDAAGTASASIVITQSPSATDATATFAGDQAADILPSSDTKPVTITKEDCTLGYTGDTLVNASTMTTLRAQFGEPDANPGNWSNKAVVFTVVDGALVSQTVNATTNAAGIATVTAALGPNVYGVSAAFAGDVNYVACATDGDTLVTVQAADAKITGGGWTSTDIGRTSFGFNVIRDVTGLHGQFQVRTGSGKNKFHGSTVLTLSSNATTGTWTGTGRWNGLDGHSFTVSVVDSGGNGKRGDTISIVIRRPGDNAVVFTTNGALTLKGGNITVKR